jgi:hypothetical protein
MTGVLRQIDNLIAQRKARNGEAGHSDWQLHIEGALGEQAVAKWIGTYWSGQVGNLSAADIGKQIETRTTHRLDGSLILHEWDQDDAYFFLLTGQHGTYRIAGWIEGRDGKLPAFWRDPVGGRPAYFVPQAVLNDPAHFMHTLRLPVASDVALPVERDSILAPRRRVPVPALAADRFRARASRQ